MSALIAAAVAGCLGIVAWSLGVFWSLSPAAYGSPPPSGAAEPRVRKVMVYFGNARLNPGSVDCAAAYPVEREIADTPAVGRAALEELLKGPTWAERNAGYFTAISDGVKLNKLTVADGVARVDFDEAMSRGMGGSCRVGAVRSQIEKTLERFPSVKRVIVSVDGRTEGVLQP